jgi:quinolinate synthase
VESVEGNTVIFGPDFNLAEFVQENTAKQVIPIPEDGFCPTHLAFDEENLHFLKAKYPSAVVLVHPECTREVRHAADFVGSTSQILHYARESAARAFIIGTEEGILHRLRKENPGKEFILAHVAGVCPNMKRNTLESIYLSLLNERYPVVIPRGIASRARIALQRMLELSV